jgi:hypothetical protein
LPLARCPCILAVLPPRLPPLPPPLPPGTRKGKPVRVEVGVPVGVQHRPERVRTPKEFPRPGNESHLQFQTFKNPPVSKDRQGGDHAARGAQRGPSIIPPWQVLFCGTPKPEKIPVVRSLKGEPCEHHGLLD